MVLNDISKSMWDAIKECECLCTKYIKYHIDCPDVAEKYKEFAKAHLMHAKAMHEIALKKDAAMKSMGTHEHEHWLAAKWSYELDDFAKKFAIVEHMYMHLG